MFKGFLWFVVILVGIGFTINLLGGTNPATTSSSAESSTTDTQCRHNLQCWGDKASIGAGIFCKKPIEHLANYDSQWTDSWYEPKMSRFGWADETVGTLRFSGDKLKFQNGFGAWSPMVYHCTYNPANNEVSDVWAEEGRID